MEHPLLQPEYLSTLTAAAQACAGSAQNRPTPAMVVVALLQAEKCSKQAPKCATYQQLLGTWRLGFVTGTRRSRKRSGIVLGAGRYLPAWVHISITYTELEASNQSGYDRPPIAEIKPAGRVINSVNMGPLSLTVAGPAQFWQRQVLSFDFTRITLALAGLNLYKGYFRGGQHKEDHFWQQPLREQAFFNYFLIQTPMLAARGRGGGLALWTRLDPPNP